MVTNPVDFLAYGTHAISQHTRHPLRTHQVYSVGLAVDAVRAARKAQDYGEGTARVSDLGIIGNHADVVKFAHSPYSPELEKVLEEYLQGASVSIRQGAWRTIYGPISSATLVLDAIVNGGGVHVGTLQDVAHMGKWTEFEHGLPVGFSEDDFTHWKEILKLNHERIAKYGHLLLPIGKSATIHS